MAGDRLHDDGHRRRRQPPVESAAPVRQLHETLIKPASEVVFNIGREAPTNDQKWTAISGAGATLVKSGNLLMLASPPENRIEVDRALSATGHRRARGSQTGGGQEPGRVDADF